MATLTGQTIASTYDALLKVTDNGPITSSLKLITDGLGNNTALSLSNVAASINGNVTATSFIKSSGTSTQYLMADGSVSTLTNPITGTGTTNTLPKFTGASALGNSNITDSGTLITLGSNTTISSGGLGIGSSSLTDTNFRVTKNITGATTAYNIISQGAIQSDVTSIATYYYSASSTQATAFTIGSVRHFHATQGTIGAGSAITTQVGFLAGSGLIGGTNNYAFQGDIPSGTNRWNLYMTGTASNYMAGSLGIGSTSIGGTTGYSFRVSKTITGATTAYGITQDGVVQSDVTSGVQGYTNVLSTQAAAFTLPNYSHYLANQGTIGATSAVTTQNGFYAISNLTGATNNYGFRGAIPAGTGRWNLYLDGTANNYMAGALGIGSTTLTGTNLRVEKNITGATVAYGIFNGGTTQSDVTGSANYFLSVPATQATTFTLPILRHYQTDQGTFGAGSTVTTQVGFNANSTLIGATNNYGFRGQIASGTNRWNLYMDGTAGNYLAGNLSVGTTTNAERLTVGGSTPFILINNDDETSSGIRFADTQNLAERFQAVFNSGDASFRLDKVESDGSIVERMRITSTGNVNVGSATDVLSSSGLSTIFKIISSNNAGILLQNHANDATGGSLYFTKTRSGIAGNYTSGVLSNDVMMFLAGEGSDGVSALRRAGSIQIVAEANFGAASSPGRIVFGTTASGSVSVTERMRINSSGNLLINSTTDNSTGAKLQVNGGITYQNIFNRQTASYTLVLADQNDIIEMNVASANNLTIPLNATVAFPIGTEIAVLQYGAGQTTIVATVGVTLRAKANALKISGQFAGCTLVKVGTDEWYVIGDLTA